jgi:hypothetical protein
MPSSWSGGARVTRPSPWYCAYLAADGWSEGPASTRRNQIAAGAAPARATTTGTEQEPHQIVSREQAGAKSQAACNL